MAAFDDITVREGVDQETVDAVRSVGERYKYGFATDIETEFAPKGLNEDIVRLISAKNGEPEWMTDWRLKAYRRWVSLEEHPEWPMLDLPEIDFQDQYYYARPKSMATRPKSLDDVDPALLATYEKLGIPLKEQMILAGVEGAEAAPADGRRVAVDAVFDSVSLGTSAIAPTLAVTRPLGESRCAILSACTVARTWSAIERSDCGWTSCQ